jgi:hypothetical protein
MMSSTDKARPSDDGGVAGVACMYANDDGSGDNDLGQAGGAGTVAMANAFFIDPDCVSIAALQVAWGAHTEGQPVTIAVYDDPNNDGDPSDITLADLVGSADGFSTANAGTDTFNNYAFLQPLDVQGRGIVFIIAITEDIGAAEFPLRFDTTSSAGASWLLLGITDTADPFQANGLLSRLDDPPVNTPGNFMVRAVGVSAPLCPTDVIVNSFTDVDELVQLILEFGQPDSDYDFDLDGLVDVDDLLLLILAWGPCPFANDLCETAPRQLAGTGTVFVGVVNCEPVSVVFNNVGADTDGGAFGCAPAGSDVWFEVVSTCNGLLTVTTDGSMFDTVLEVYGGSDCPGVPIACDDNGGEDGVDSALEIAVVAGDRLKIRVGGVKGAEGAGTLNLCCAEDLGNTPPNDDCETAILLTPGDSDTQQTFTATADDVPPCGKIVQAPGVWYTFAGTGNAMTVSLCTGTDYDTILNPYCLEPGGDCSTLGCIGADDDAGCGEVGGPSAITVCSEAGRTYYAFVHGFEGATGTFTIELSETVGAAGCAEPDPCVPIEVPANDSCQNASVIEAGLTGFSTLLATTDPSTTNPLCASRGDGGMIVNDIWFRYTVSGPSENLQLTISTCEDLEVGAAADYDTDIRAYAIDEGGGLPCGTLADALIGCNDDGCPPGDPDAPWHSNLVVPVQDGQEILIQVGGWGGGGEGDIGEGTLFIGVSESDNDICEFAELVNPGPASGPITIQTELCSATIDENAPICGSAADDNGRWFELEGTGNIWTIQTCNDDPANDGVLINTRMNVYCFAPQAGAANGCDNSDAEPCDNLACAGDEPIDNGPCAFTEMFELETVPGFRYYVLVQGTSDSGGLCVGTIDVTFTEGVASVDPQCVAAIGACCTDDGATCIDAVADSICAQMGGDLLPGTCAEVTCFVPCKSFSTTIQQHCSDTPITGTVRCESGDVQRDNWFYRQFDAADGFTNGDTICSVQVAIDTAIDNGLDGFTTIQICLYDVPIDLLAFNPDGTTATAPVLCRTFPVTDAMSQTIQTFEIGGQISADQVVMEVYTPTGAELDCNANSVIALGDNQPGQSGCDSNNPCGDCGETTPGPSSFVRAPACGAFVPTPMDSLGCAGCPGAALIWKLNIQ